METHVQTGSSPNPAHKGHLNLRGGGSKLASSQSERHRLPTVRSDNMLG